VIDPKIVYQTTEYAKKNNQSFTNFKSIEHSYKCSVTDVMESQVDKIGTYDSTESTDMHNFLKKLKRAVQYTRENELSQRDDSTSQNPYHVYQNNEDARSFSNRKSESILMLNKKALMVDRNDKIVRSVQRSDANPIPEIMEEDNELLDFKDEDDKSSFLVIDRE